MFLSNAPNSGLLDYFSAVFGEMPSYHAVGEFLLGGSHRNNGLAQVYYRCRLTLERQAQSFGVAELIAFPLYTRFRSSGNQFCAGHRFAGPPWDAPFRRDSSHSFAD